MSKAALKSTAAKTRDYFDKPLSKLQLLIGTIVFLELRKEVQDLTKEDCKLLFSSEHFLLLAILFWKKRQLHNL